MSATIDINGKKLLPIKEVILQVDYSRDYITRLAREKKIVATQIGRHWYIDLDSLQNYQVVAQTEQEIKKRQLSEERKKELAIKEQKQKKRAVARERVKRKIPAVATMGLIMVLGMGLGVVLESQWRTNFVGVTQLANIKTFALEDGEKATLQVSDFVSDTPGQVSPAFTPTVTYKDLTSDEGLLLLPVTASGSVRTQEYFSDPVTIVEDEEGYSAVRRVDEEGNPTGDKIPFVLVPINANSP